MFSKENYAEIALKIRNATKAQLLSWKVAANDFADKNPECKISAEKISRMIDAEIDTRYECLLLDRRRNSNKGVGHEV